MSSGLSQSAIRRAEEDIELPLATSEDGSAVVVTIRAIPPIKMLAIRRGLPGMFMASLTRLEQYEKLSAAKDASDDEKARVEREELDALSTFLEGAKPIIEAGCVRPRFTFDEQVLAADPDASDAQVLSIVELSFLVGRILGLSGHGGAAAVELARFRVLERRRGIRGSRAVDVGGGDGERAVDAAVPGAGGSAGEAGGGSDGDAGGVGVPVAQGQDG